MTATAQEDARGLACGPVVVQSGVGQVCKSLCVHACGIVFIFGGISQHASSSSSLLFKRAVILARPAFGARNMVPVIPGRRENNKTKQSVILHWFVHERWSFFLLLLRFHMCSFSLSLCVCLHAGLLRFIGLPSHARLNQPATAIFVLVSTFIITIYPIQTLTHNRIVFFSPLLSLLIFVPSSRRTDLSPLVYILILPPFSTCTVIIIPMDLLDCLFD